MSSKLLSNNTLIKYLDRLNYSTDNIKFVSGIPYYGTIIKINNSKEIKHLNLILLSSVLSSENYNKDHIESLMLNVNTIIENIESYKIINNYLIIISSCVDGFIGYDNSLTYILNDKSCIVKQIIELIMRLVKSIDIQMKIDILKHVDLGFSIENGKMKIKLYIYHEKTFFSTFINNTFEYYNLTNNLYETESTVYDILSKFFDHITLAQSQFGSKFFNMSHEYETINGVTQPLFSYKNYIIQIIPLTLKNKHSEKYDILITNTKDKISKDSELIYKKEFYTKNYLFVIYE